MIWKITELIKLQGIFNFLNNQKHCFQFSTVMFTYSLPFVKNTLKEDSKLLFAIFSIKDPFELKNYLFIIKKEVRMIPMFP